MMMFDPDLLDDPEFRTRVQAARALIAERVRRGVATPTEQLAVAVLEEMPDEDDPDAVRAWAPSAAFREAVRSAARSPPPPSTSASSRRSPTKPTKAVTAAARRCTDTALLQQAGEDEVLVRTVNRRALHRHLTPRFDRFRNRRPIFTPPRELQAAISNALRATGKLDDFEVAALVLAGVMKKVHLRHPSYREQAACGQPSSPTTGTA